MAFAALALASPAGAQSSPPRVPEDDLKCAAWAAIVIGINKDKPDVVSHLTAGLMWFLARYEGATGKKFEQGLTPEFITRVGPELPKIEVGCQERIQQVGTRLSAWGQSLQAASKAAEQGSAAK